MRTNDLQRRPGGRHRSTRPGMALLLAVFAATIVAVALGGAASAHPLGNFTINRYARVEVGAGRVRVRYVLDMAEIPTLQEKNDTIDRNHHGRLSDDEKAAYLARKVESLRSGLHVALNGTGVDLKVATETLSFPAGQGGLETMRIESWFDAPLPASSSRAIGNIDVRDDNYNDRLGWKELILRGIGGVTLTGSSVPSQDASDELRTYPQDALSSPVDRRSASSLFQADPAAEQAAAASLPALHSAEPGSGVVVSRSQTGFTKLITEQRVTAQFLAFALIAALVFGGLHAMGPGHGKTVVAAYLVGARGTARHAVFLGLTVTATHTIGVFALGFVTLSLSQYILPERLFPWLSLISGIIVAAMGLVLLIARLRSARRPARAPARSVDAFDAHTHGGHEHGPGEHAHAHQSGEPHAHGVGGRAHRHALPGADGSQVTWRSLLGLGISGGILPCPSALVVLLTAISIHRVALGMVLIVAFSVGLAAVLTGIGLLLVHAGRLFNWLRLDGRLTRLLPVGSAFVVMVAGVLITAQTWPQAGTLHP